MFTAEGIARWAELLAADLRGGKMIVGDGDGQEATAPIESVTTDAGAVTVSAVFPEDAANFDWRVRYIASVSGVVVDGETLDMGRKAAGAVWRIESVLELSPAED